VSEHKDTILVIDGDSEEASLFVDGALVPFGYEADYVADGGAGLAMVLESLPDILVLDLNPVGLSGYDILAALNAQAVDVPVILLVDPQNEQAARQAFRLGARDYLVRPVRETELIQSVEQLMNDVRLRRDRESLVSEARHADEEAEQRLRELKTLMGIGKSVTALTDQNEVLDRVIRAAIQLTKAETVGIFLLDHQTDELILHAGQNLSRNLLDHMGEPIDDDLATMIMNSQETYIASGEGLRRYPPAQQGATAVIYAPMAVQENSIGVLWVANTRLPFEPFMKDLMTALGDYAAIAVANARLFATMEERTQQLEVANVQLQAQQDEVGQGEAAPVGDGESAVRSRQELAGQIRSPLTEILGNLNLFRTGEMGPLPASHQAAVDVMHRQVEALVLLIDDLSPPDTGGL